MRTNMKYGELPTWEDCHEKQELDDVMPEGRGLLDPVEIFIHNQEPCDDALKHEFRQQLQTVVDFLSNN